MFMASLFNEPGIMIMKSFSYRFGLALATLALVAISGWRFSQRPAGRVLDMGVRNGLGRRKYFPDRKEAEKAARTNRHPHWAGNPPRRSCFNRAPGLHSWYGSCGVWQIELPARYPSPTIHGYDKTSAGGLGWVLRKRITFCDSINTIAVAPAARMRSHSSQPIGAVWKM